MAHIILGTERPKREANLIIIYCGSTKKEKLCHFFQFFLILCTQGASGDFNYGGF